MSRSGGSTSPAPRPRSSNADPGLRSCCFHGGIECGGVYWAPVIPRLAERPPRDRPGCSRARRVRAVRQRRHRSVLAWLTALVEECCAEPPVLVAHSLLGSYAARFAAVAAGSSNGSSSTARPRDRGVPDAARAPRRRDPRRPAPEASEAARSASFHGPSSIRSGRGQRYLEWFAAFISYMQRASGRRSAQEDDDAAPRSDRQTKGFQTRSCAGSMFRQPCSGVGTTGWPRSALPRKRTGRLGWPLEVVENAGHVPHIEQPEAFVGVLDRPARSNGPNGGRHELRIRHTGSAFTPGRTRRINHPSSSGSGSPMDREEAGPPRDHSRQRWISAPAAASGAPSSRPSGLEAHPGTPSSSGRSNAPANALPDAGVEIQRHPAAATSAHSAPDQVETEGPPRPGHGNVPRPQCGRAHCDGDAAAGIGKKQRTTQRCW